MNRAWLGLCLLIVLFLIGIGITAVMDDIHEPLSEYLEDAAEEALEGNWPQAEHAFDLARSRWEKYRQLSAAAADHAPMEDIAARFARLEVHLRGRDASHFAAGCMHLSQLTQALGEAHEISWWNLL